MKFLKLSSLYLNLSDITILFMSTNFKSIGSSDLWNSFYLPQYCQILMSFHSFL